MKLIIAAAALTATLLLAPGAGAAKHHKSKNFGAVRCPVCGMHLARKASKKQPKAIRVAGYTATQYCCAGCAMPKAWSVKKHH